MQGFLNLNKSAGFTSHDCVAKVRRLLQIKKVGHGGTLDPAATGVLPIAVGRATRLLQFLHPDKAYRATIRFGLTTTTDDLEGEALTAQACPDLTLEQIEAVLPQLLGTIEQIPPSYSAIQVEGQRLYHLARQGKLVDVPSRTVRVDRIEILDWRSQPFPELDVAIACGPGTYIRAIARDLGDILGVGATLAQLTRTCSSSFALTDSLTLSELADQVQTDTLTLTAPDEGLQHLTAVTLAAPEAKRWRQGQKIEACLSCSSDPLRIYDETGLFLGVGQVGEIAETPHLCPKMVFAPWP